MSKKALTVTMRPSSLLKRMMEHKGDLSEGSKAKVTARRVILGKRVTFYENGLRVVEDPDLSEKDVHGSEILRLAQASLITGNPEGDKAICYVDATVNPVIVYVYGQIVKDFIGAAKRLIASGQLDQDFVLNSTIRETEEKTDGQSVSLFRR